MNYRIYKWLNTKYPQNYIIRNPFIGALIISVFCFAFSAFYKPHEFHASSGLSYETTMAIYSLIAGGSLIIFVWILKNIRWFIVITGWTIFKELFSVLFVLTGMGIVVYLSGLLVEPPGNRWHIPTFLNSFKNVFFVAIYPFAFFSALNYRYLFPKNTTPGEGINDPILISILPPEDLLHIGSQLKKEELCFYPAQFIFAESEGNYVIFYLTTNGLIKKQIIRNSISNIEQQLSLIPYFLRTHRSYIVNLKKVKSKKGNILGYQLKLTDTEFKIPVSRNRTKIFDKQFTLYQNS
jgi:branched-subunit amino acid transport protein